MDKNEKLQKTEMKMRKPQNISKPASIAFFVQITGLGLIIGAIATNHVVKIMIAIGIVLIFLAIIFLVILIIFNKASKNLA